MKSVELRPALRASRDFLTAVLLALGLALAPAEKSWGADPTDVVVVTAEHAAFFGSGGLGVMIDAWTRSLEEEYRLNGNGATVTVIMPFYMRFYQKAGLIEQLHDEGTEVTIGLDYGQTTFAARQETFRAYSAWHGRVKIVFLRHQNRFGEGNYFDNQLHDGAGPLYAPASREWEAFAAFGKAAARYTYGFLPRTDLLVLNDWHVALTGYFTRHPDFIGFAGRTPPKVLGISHNFAHQGIADRKMIGVIGLDSREFNPEGYEHNGKINNLKMLFNYATMPKTVSLSHARETLTPRFGRTFEGFNQKIAREYRYTAILNGIDGDQWDPSRIAREILPQLSPDAATDLEQYVFNEHDLSGLERGTRLVQDVFGLNRDPEAMIYVSTARPDPQKGFEYLPGALEYVMLRDPHVQVVFVGNPAPGVEREEWAKRFVAFTRDSRFQGRVIWKKFANELEYAALTWGTLNLAFSTQEPAGQTVQMSSNVGTVSAGNRVGGIAESIVTDHDRRTGFLADVAYYSDGKTLDSWKTGENVIRVLEEANRLYREDRTEWNRMVVNALRSQIVWKKQIKLYRQLFGFMLDDGSSKLMQAYGPAPAGRVYSVEELMAKLARARMDCGTIMGGKATDAGL